MFWAALIFALSSIPDLGGSEPVVRYQDKVAHFFIFGILGFLTTRAVVFSCREAGWRSVFAGLIFIAVYAALDEFHQSFVPGRSVEVADFMADFLGAGVFVLIGYRIFTNKKKMEEE